MATATDPFDIASCIADLLYLRDTVILPGLGAFEGVYKAAAVDAVQGVVHPPGKKLSFNPNLKVDDGVLVREIAEKQSWTDGKARRELEAYIARLRQSLDKREIIDIAGVGRLYVDFKGEYVFLPLPQHFSAASYGLPDVQFNPLKRRPVAGASAVPASEPRIRPAQPSFWSRFKPDTSVFWLSALALLILAISIVLIVSRLEPGNGPALIIQPPPPIAVSPGDDMSDDEAPELDEDNAFVTGSLGELVDTEAPTRPPGVLEAVAIIGAFCNEKNAEKQIQTLFMDGYEAYSDQKDGTTRVGIRLAYESEAELQEKLAVIQTRYNPKAWVFYPED